MKAQLPQWGCAFLFSFMFYYPIYLLYYFLFASSHSLTPFSFILTKKMMADTFFVSTINFSISHMLCL